MAVKRAKELAVGAPKLVETESRKVTTIALEEIRQGKVVYVPPADEEESKGESKKSRKEKALAGAKKK